MLVLIIIVAIVIVVVLIRNPLPSGTENPSPQKGNKKWEPRETASETKGHFSHRGLWGSMFLPRWLSRRGLMALSGLCFSQDRGSVQRLTQIGSPGLGCQELMLWFQVPGNTDSLPHFLPACPHMQWLLKKGNQDYLESFQQLTTFEFPF